MEVDLLPGILRTFKVKYIPGLRKLMILPLLVIEMKTGTDLVSTDYDARAIPVEEQDRGVYGCISKQPVILYSMSLTRLPPTSKELTSLRTQG